jgi:hypothetical protein
VLHALADAHARASLVLHQPERERERAGLLRDLGKGRARRLHLELVRALSLTEDGRPGRVGRLELQRGGEPSFPSVLGQVQERENQRGTHSPVAVGDDNVEAVDLSLLKDVGVVRVASLRSGRERDQALLRLEVVLRELAEDKNCVSLGASMGTFRQDPEIFVIECGSRASVTETDLVGEDALDTLDTARLVLLQEALDGLGHLPVADTGLDSAESNLARLVRGLEQVGADARNLGSADDKAVERKTGTRVSRRHRGLTERYSHAVLTRADARKEPLETHVSPATTG